MTARLTPRARRLQPLHAWLLAVLLLAAQTLGLTHRVAHAPGLAGAVVAQATASANVFAAATATALEAAAESAGAPAHAHSHFPHEAGSADCRLIDQLEHADVLCAGVCLPPALPRAAVTGAAATLPTVSAGGAAAYLARGPPAGDSARISARA
jgi:hypothetical protein